MRSSRAHTAPCRSVQALKIWTRRSVPAAPKRAQYAVGGSLAVANDKRRMSDSVCGRRCTRSGTTFMDVKFIAARGSILCELSMTRVRGEMPAWDGTRGRGVWGLNRLFQSNAHVLRACGDVCTISWEVEAAVLCCLGCFQAGEPLDAASMASLAISQHILSFEHLQDQRALVHERAVLVSIGCA